MPSDQVQTLKRSISLLDCFSTDQPSLGVREAARKAGLSSSTTGRLLAAMKDSGLLTQDPLSRAYSLGPKVLAWSGVYSSTLDVRAIAMRDLEELHRATQETVSLYILDGGDRVCVERLESPHNVRVSSRIGLRLPLYAGSAGKAMLAFLPAARREEIIAATPLAPLTAKTITSPEELRSELEKVRRDGYAVSRGEWQIDASGVAAPVFDHSSAPVAAVTISGPAQRFSDEAIEKYTRLILPVAARISQEMGFPISRGYPPISQKKLQE
jgi:DNA-binding IclR family transcriptional regulator